MPPRRKSRRLAEPTVSDATEVQFVPDPVEIQPQQAVAAFTGEDTTPSDTLVSTIVAAVRTAIQSTSAVQPTNVVEAAVQDDVSQLSSGSGGEVLPHSPVFHSIAVPLGSRISARIKAKIWAEEFVDFGSLLDPSPTPDKYSLSFTAPSSDSPKTPQFTFEPVQNPKKVSSINDWVSAFHTFVAIYCVKFPTETPKLMKFCETVRDIATRGGDWCYYDEQFRYIRQANPRQYPWDIVHWELWHRAVTFRANYSPFQPGKPNAKYKGKPSMAKGVCWTFNAGRHCPGCRYEHKCHKCGGKHTGAQCQSTSTGHNGGDRTSSAHSNTKQPASYARKSVST
ncbi:uncharacterized protein LOC122963589 [Acropora millepora]|uniref:uncharacterized protein LOC122963589 n=1 Tax=Acropora millepora TaxID=45264 RepID=UPI001CF41303|nr:uncharacterized protein LOC122963589 [Acropora millepora]